MKQYKHKDNQQGIALLAAVMIIVIFAIMGMMSAKQAKQGEQIAGANVRYGTVFEAAELTLRDAMDYLRRIQGGAPYIGVVGSGGRTMATNFNPTNLVQVDVKSDPAKAIVWDRGELKKAFCDSCQSLDFSGQMDSAKWKRIGIPTTFAAGDNIAGNNYLKDIETYTFIEALQSGNGGKVGEQFNDTAMQANAGGGSSADTPSIFYLITVKASGFPPGTANKTAGNSRENVILQAVLRR